MSTIPKLLIISHDVIGTRMAGPGIRAWEAAHVLCQQQPVTLIAPQPIDRSPEGFAIGSYSWGDAASLALWLADADVVFANGFVLRAHPELASFARPLALDLYDPVILEALEAERSLAADQRAARHAIQRDLLRRQLLCGDFLCCATERQRDLYIGALTLSGRLDPALSDADPTLRTLIDVVPFGLSNTQPAQKQHALRGRLPGIAHDDQIILWTGGMWDWLDPLSLVEAMPAVITRCPNVRLVFLAGKHPGPVAAMRAPMQTRQRADALGLTNRHVFFYDDWVPYAQRADVLLDADLAVSLHYNHLETSYAAVRSRFLDHLWAGLASIVSAGDSAAELVEKHQLGLVVPVADSAAIAAAIIELLENQQRRHACGQRAAALAASFTWEQVLRPLAHFCLHPLITRKQLEEAPQAPQTVIAAPQAAPSARQAALEQDYLAFKQQLAQLHQLWQVRPQALDSAIPLLGRAKQTANSLTEWYLQPIIEQQNAFNAATARAIQALADTFEQMLRDDVDRRIQERFELIQHEQEPIRQHIADIEQHLLDIDDAQTTIARRLATSDEEVRR